MRKKKQIKKKWRTLFSGEGGRGKVKREETRKGKMERRRKGTIIYDLFCYPRVACSFLVPPSFFANL